jgi:hypothetical protein
MKGHASLNDSPVGLLVARDLVALVSVWPSSQNMRGRTTDLHGLKIRQMVEPALS